MDKGRKWAEMEVLPRLNTYVSWYLPSQKEYFKIQKIQNMSEKPSHSYKGLQKKLWIWKQMKKKNDRGCKKVSVFEYNKWQE